MPFNDYLMNTTMHKSSFGSIEDLLDSQGKEIGLTDWIDIDQDRITQFAKLTMDEQWIHVDQELSRKASPFKKTIAHGFLILSLFTHFLESCVEIKGFKMGLNYGFDKVRFTNPVVVGSRLRGRFSLLNVDQGTHGVKLKYGVQIEIEGQDKPACVAEWLGMIIA